MTLTCSHCMQMFDAGQSSAAGMQRSSQSRVSSVHENDATSASCVACMSRHSVMLVYTQGPMPVYAYPYAPAVWSKGHCDASVHVDDFQSVVWPDLDRITTHSDLGLYTLSSYRKVCSAQSKTSYSCPMLQLGWPHMCL